MSKKVVVDPQSLLGKQQVNFTQLLSSESNSNVKPPLITSPNSLSKSLYALHLISFRILVVDKFTESLLNKIFRVGELRALGITLVLDINDKREYVRDATACYFILPTEQNIDILAKDIINELYFDYEVHFAERSRQTILESLAKKILDSAPRDKQDNYLQRIKFIKDQFLAFHSIDFDFFSLELDQMFYKTLNPKIQNKSEMEDIIERVANGLVNVVLTYGTMPIIAFEKNVDTPATFTARLVVSKLNDLYHSSNREIRQFLVNEQNGPNRFTKRRPVLLLTDRTFDLSVAVQHRWRYRSMVHDIFGMKNNHVIVPVKEEVQGENKIVKRQYDINPIYDSLWKKYSGKSYHEVASQIPEELTEYEKELKVFNKKSGINISGDEMLSGDMNKKLEGEMKLSTSIINKVFKLSDQRKYVDMHTNIAFSLLETIKERKLDEFYALEEALITQKPLDQKDLNVIQSLFESDTNLVSDKIRLLIICYLSLISSKKSSYSTSITEDDLKKYEKNIQKQRLIEEKKEIPQEEKLLVLSEMNFIRSLALDQTMLFDQPKGRDDRLGKIKSNVLDSFNVLGTQLKSIASNLRGGDASNFYPLPLTQLVHSIMNSGDSELTRSSSMSSLSSSSVFKSSEKFKKNYQFFDPKKNETIEATGEFGEAIVFVFGGGNFFEYQNLLDFNELPFMQGKRIVYGSTSLLTGEEFLNELKQLGDSLS